jgi:phospholipid/cholesterol/gamma-HCH transport system substrate-binding protein/paraquat-inducible protein B
MTSEQRYYRIGLFVLVAVGVVVTAVVALGAGAMFEKKYRVETYMDESIEGLDVGSPVKYRGVKIGELEATDFVASTYNNKDGRIRLILAFHHPPGRMIVQGSSAERIQRLVDMGMRVHLASAGLVGDVYLELELLDPKENPPPAISWEPVYPYLPSTASAGTQVTGRVVSILHHLEGMRFDEMSVRLVTLLESLDKVVNKIGPAVADVHTAASEALGLIKDTRRLITEDLGKQLKDVIASSADHLPSTFEKLERSLDRIAATLRRVDRTLAEEGGSMDEALDNLRAATGDLRDLVGEVKRSPSQALFGEAPPKKEVTK